MVKRVGLFCPPWNVQKFWLATAILYTKLETPFPVRTWVTVSTLGWVSSVQSRVQRGCCSYSTNTVKSQKWRYGTSLQLRPVLIGLELAPLTLRKLKDVNKTCEIQNLRQSPQHPLSQHGAGPLRREYVCEAKNKQTKKYGNPVLSCCCSCLMASVQMSSSSRCLATKRVLEM